MKKRSGEVKPGSAVHEDLPLVLRVLRDITDQEVDKMRIDSRETYERIEKFVSQFTPELKGKLDGIAVPKSGDYTKFKCQELYDHIHRLQPQVLVSYKQMLLGSEDFAAPERAAASLEERVAGILGPESAAVAKRAWEKNRHKPVERCDTLLPHSWGYDERQEAEHRTADDVMALLEDAWDAGANLLLNTGPLGDGSIPEADVETLREVGKRLRRR